MAGRFSRSLELARASWAVVKADKELMWFPVMSVIALGVILGSLAVPVAVVAGLAADGDAASGAASWLGLLAVYIVAWFIGLFFNTALVGAAMIRMDGGDPTVGDGLRIAWARVWRIFGYACIAGTVGVLLRMLEERLGWIGDIVVKLIGVAWALASFLVVPVLVTRDVGPVDAVKESAVLLKQTWGENIIGSVGLGFVFGVAYFVLLLACGALATLAIQAGLPALVAAVVLVGIVAFMLLATLQSTMQGVYSAALYRYASHSGTPPAGFEPGLLERAFKPKA